MVKNVQQTPVVDGTGLKMTLERYAAQTLVDELGPTYQTGRVMHTAAVDRYGLALGFFEMGYETVCCDLMFVLGIPIPSPQPARLAYGRSYFGPHCHALADQHALPNR